MAKYAIGIHVFEADNLVEAIEHVRSQGWSGTMKRVTDRPVIKALTTDRQIVKVTCGWGHAAHTWQTTKGDAVQFRNTCPQHRS